MFNTILVPTDGSDTAWRATGRAAELARTFDADLHLLNVVDVQSVGGAFGAGGVPEDYVDRLRDGGREILESTEMALGDVHVQESVVVTGYPPDEILEYAEGHGIDLIVMGTHGRTGPARYILGSVTENVVRHADVPVLAVGDDGQGTDGDGYREVMIPTDGSDPATAAIAPGLAIARKFDARVHAVNVVDVGALGVSPTLTPPEERIEQLRSEGETMTRTVADRARDTALDAVTEVRIGRPSSQLLEYAGEHDVDLIAMGTTGRSGLGEHLLGSTTERVLRGSEVPVLAVPSEERASDGESGR